jgi:hypothetical protein
MDIVASEAPKTHKGLMMDHGFDPQTASTANFVKICKRAEIQDSIQLKCSSNCWRDDSSDNDERRSKKFKKKARTAQAIRQEFCCREHGPNSTHGSKDCEVLNGAKKEVHEKKDSSESECSDCKWKHKRKHAGLSLL